MLIIYSFLSLFLLVNINFYVVWFLMEIMFLFFLLYIISVETKSVGLIIYYFFQSFLSLFLFMVVFMMMSKLIFMILVAKLGLFPFFYWVVVVSMKVGILGNIFVLALQKLPVFWLFWLLNSTSIILLFLLCYLGMIFVVINLSLVVDLWMLLVYSSIANTGLLLVSSLGSYYILNIFLYLGMVSLIVFLVSRSSNYFEMLLIVLLFLVIPPFILFFMKLFIVISMESLMKLSFFYFYFWCFYFILLFYFFIYKIYIVWLFYFNLFYKLFGFIKNSIF